jgi:alpha-tubulin suppressor-like RCC1 family protein
MVTAETGDMDVLRWAAAISRCVAQEGAAMFSRNRTTSPSVAILLLCAALLTEAAGAAPPTLQSVAVTPAVRSLSVGEHQRYTATGTFSDGSTRALEAAIRNIAPGYQGTCVLLTSGGVDCWGDNYDGKLGDGSTVASLIPRPVKWITTATAVTYGANHGCALLDSGAVTCWGGSEELGHGDVDVGAYSTRPVRVKGISSATALAAFSGGFHTCAVLASGAVRCWGNNWDGQLGNGTKTQQERTPVPVTGISSAIALGLGDRHSCAVLASGAVRCWGANSHGQLGNGTHTSSYVPVTVKGIGSATAVAAGLEFSCALLASGEVKCWGFNGAGELGNGSFINSRVPVAVAGITTAVSITAGAYHACALLSSGSAKCWGDNYEGQLGDGSTISSNTPVRVSEISAPVSLAAGYWHTCALLSDGAMRCWGRDHFGQLGDRQMTEDPNPLPVAVVGTPGVVWESSDPSKGTITMRGLATGLAVGNTTITATTAGFINDNAVLTVK